MLLVSGPNVFDGYLDSDMQPFVTFEGKRWYRTGDLVSEAPDGCLTFRGRLKRFIKVGGEMISLPQIESILQEAVQKDPDTASTGNSSMPVDSSGQETAADGPLVAIESGTDGRIVLFSVPDITREQANAILRAAGLSGLSSVARVQRLKTIPVLGTGKTDYRTLRELCDNKVRQ